WKTVYSKAITILLEYLDIRIELTSAED
ncbi:MAG: hypothetical protein RLZZ535_689, partial [Cyanobacteriota bacterium]